MNFEEKLWDLSNTIAGFGIVQAISFLVAFGSSEFLAKNVLMEIGSVIFFIIICSAVYIMPILIIGFVWMSGRESDKVLWRRATLLRASGVFMVNLLVILVVSGARL